MPHHFEISSEDVKKLKYIQKFTGTNIGLTLSKAIDTAYISYLNASILVENILNAEPIDYNAY